MLLDLVIGIIASLIASVILGFLGNKAISKHDDNTIMKAYVLFLSSFVFVVCSALTIILNNSFLERIMKMSEANILKFYQNCINTFVNFIPDNDMIVWSGRLIAAPKMSGPYSYCLYPEGVSTMGAREYDEEVLRSTSVYSRFLSLSSVERSRSTPSRCTS